MSTAIKAKVTPETPVTMRVVSARVVAGNYGEQVLFEGEEPQGGVVAVYEKKENVERQLALASLTLDTVVGRTVTLRKEIVANKSGQTFPALRIDVAGAAAAPRTTGAPARVPMAMGGPLPGEDAPAFAGDPGPSTLPGTDKFASLAALHARCFKTALLYADEFSGAQVAGDVAGAVSALTAQLFIAATQRGLAA